MAVFFSLPSYNSFPASDKTLKYFSILQSYTIFAVAYAVLVKAGANFGSQPDCNALAKVTIFRAFNILPVGRILAIILLSTVTVLYTISTVIDYRPIRFSISNINGSQMEWTFKAAIPPKDGPLAQGTESSGTATSNVTQLQSSLQNRQPGHEGRLHAKVSLSHRFGIEGI